MYNYIQGFGNAARARVKEIIYFASTLRHAVRNNPAEGPTVTTNLKHMYIAIFVCYVYEYACKAHTLLPGLP